MAANNEKSLYEVFGELPDPRNPCGRRHSLAACLTLCAAAILCGSRSLFAIAQWGRDHDELGEALGFTRQKRRWPCVSTLHYLFKAVGVARLEAALTAWMLAQGASDIKLHYVRDVTMGEDACRVRSGSAPQLLAGVRNLAIGLLARAGIRNKAEALRRHATQPIKALVLLLGRKAEN